jgi:hypothetical protein
MTNPTSNFGWQMPEPTDLVTNLPADFEVFGQAVDSDFADLLGGTTGQVLKKNTNADLDFVWGADSAGMTNPMTTTGDIIYSSPGSTPVRLGIGSTSQVLTVASGVPSWASPAGGGKVLQVVYGSTQTDATNSTSTYADTGLTASITPTLNTSKVLILLSQNGCRSSNGSDNNQMQAKLLRGATDLITFCSQGGMHYNASIYNGFGSASCEYLDTPATTSSITYKTQFMNANNTAAVSVQTGGDSRSTMILMEIGA